MMLPNILFAGLGTSFLGSLPPGIISLMGVETYLRKHWAAALWFALGAALVDSLQAFVSFQLLGVIDLIPWFSKALTVLCVPIFMVLGIVQWNAPALTTEQALESRRVQRQMPSFFHGMFISSLNMVAVPFWLVWQKVYAETGVLRTEVLSHQVAFSVGTGAGAFIAFVGYMLFAAAIKRHLTRFSRYVNRFIALFFIGLSLMMAYRVVMQYWGGA